MMIPMEPSDFTTKQEETIIASSFGNARPFRAKTSSSWSRLKDPRIVCVSRAFGGKDRHSKVCTVRGIRDRRVRLSVPTAIQLYDLQDRLGLSQPSKVVDWLLNAAKHGIDELPPLEIPDGCFSNMINSHGLQPGKGNPKTAWNDNQRNPKSSPGVEGEEIREFDQLDCCLTRDSDSACFPVPGSLENPVSRETACSQFPGRVDGSGSRETACFQIPGLYNSILRFDPSNLTLSQIPGSPGLAGQPDQDLCGFGLLQLPPMAPVPSGMASHPPVLVCQPGMISQPFFPSQIAGTDNEFAPKQSIFLGSDFAIQSAIRTVPFNTTTDLLNLERNSIVQRKGNNEFHA